MGFFLQIRFCTGLAFSRFNGAGNTKQSTPNASHKED
jgi:hypothetical protein